MRVLVNDNPVHVTPGMKVKHALLQAGFIRDLRDGCDVVDEWGNAVGMDGALTEGLRIYTRCRNSHPVR